jgi:DNA-binding CsgD family transcriptional regulator
MTPENRPLERAAPVKDGISGVSVRDLVEQLVLRILKGEGLFRSYETDADGHDILLDMEVDSVHYLLVRQRAERTRLQSILTPREQEIARMVAKGYPNKTIAAMLDISSWTVSTHLRRTFSKLGVGSRAAMVAHLVEDGLLAKGSN